MLSLWNKLHYSLALGGVMPAKAVRSRVAFDWSNAQR